MLTCAVYLRHPWVGQPPGVKRLRLSTGLVKQVAVHVESADATAVASPEPLVAGRVTPLLAHTAAPARQGCAGGTGERALERGGVRLHALGPRPLSGLGTHAWRRFFSSFSQARHCQRAMRESCGTLEGPVADKRSRSQAAIWRARGGAGCDGGDLTWRETQRLALPRRPRGRPAAQQTPSGQGGEERQADRPQA